MTPHDRLREIEERVASRGEAGYEVDLFAIARELDAELQEAVKLCHEARKAISQGRIAVEDEQDMTDWHVQTGPLQARLEQMVARHEEAIGEEAGNG